MPIHSLHFEVGEVGGMGRGKGGGGVGVRGGAGGGEEKIVV